MSDLTKYSAASAKVRAMYGKRLTEAQWDFLRNARSLSDVWAAVRQSGAWVVVAAEPRCASDAELFVQTLHCQLEQDCKNIRHYIPREEGHSLGFFLDRGDLTPEALQQFWRSKGASLSGLKKFIGAEADVLNLVYILRLRRFPASKGRVWDLLIPVREYLRPELAESLLHARDDDAVRAILDGTRWGGTFQSLAPGDLERQYDAYMQQFCGHIIRSGQSGLAVAQALLQLKEMDEQKLVRVIAAVGKGMNPSLVV